MRKEIDLKYATRLINHGPVVLVSAFSKETRLGVTPVAWCMPIRKSPPKLILEIGAKHFIRECITESADFAVNILSFEYAKDIIYCGSVSGRDEDKLEKTGFTSEKSLKISSDRLSEAIGVLECKVCEDELAEKHNLVIGEVVHAEAEENLFTDHWDFEKDGPKTVHHLGGRIFCVPSAELIPDQRRG